MKTRSELLYTNTPYKIEGEVIARNAKNKNGEDDKNGTNTAIRGAVKEDFKIREGETELAKC